MDLRKLNLSVIYVQSVAYNNGVRGFVLAMGADYKIVNKIANADETCCPTDVEDELLSLLDKEDEIWFSSYNEETSIIDIYKIRSKQIS